MESETIELIYNDMKICAVCGEVFGRIRFPGEPRVSWQPCNCGRTPAGSPAGDDLAEYLNLDFSQAVTLCYGCGRELVQSGSKWSLLFCEYCYTSVRHSSQPNLLSPWWIPVGRHSLMNGLSLGGPDAQDEQKVEQFVQAVNSLPERIEHLQRWKRLVISRNREEAGFPKEGDIQLAAYLKAVPRYNVAKQKTIAPLWSFFMDKFGRPSGKERDVSSLMETSAQAPDKEVEEECTQYTSEKEIRCVLYTLVVRNQALVEKYRGGLRRFLKRYGGEYNDEITTLCYMNPEYGSDVADLEANGLERSKDFVVLIDDLYGPPSCHKDFEPYPFDVPWLRGYYHHGNIMVFMVS